MLADIFEYAILPITIVVGLPVSIIWLFVKSHMNKHNKQAELIKLAIEHGCQTDIALLIGQLNGKSQVNNTKYKLLRLLQAGCLLTGIGLSLLASAALQGYIGGYHPYWSSQIPIIGLVCLFIGITLIISFYISKKMMKRELAAEAEAMEKEAKAKQQA